MSLAKSYSNGDNLTPEGVEKRLFISDFHDTLSTSEGIREGYLRALIKMQLAGHNVVIASGDYANAQEQIDSTSLVDDIFQEMGLSAEDQESVKDNLLKVIDKGSLVRTLKERGVFKVPCDVWCDDMEAGFLANVHLVPKTDEFVAFVALAQSDPNLALNVLGSGLDKLNACLKSKDIPTAEPE